jgi:CRP/FNR family nitrogen fixation transcriptional regulator
VLDGLHLSFGPGETIFDEGQPADRIYQLISGSLRTCRILRDGRRQIEAFHFAGDVFGLESGETYRAAAQTLGPPRCGPCRARPWRPWPASAATWRADCWS